MIADGEFIQSLHRENLGQKVIHQDSVGVLRGPTGEGSRGFPAFATATFGCYSRIFFATEGDLLFFGL